MKQNIILILILGVNLFSQVFEMDLEGSMEETILGTPIYINIEIKNISGKEQKLAGEFRCRYILKGINGEEAELRSGIEASYRSCEKVRINYIPSNWKDVKVVDISQFFIRRKGKADKEKIREAGEYRIEVIASPRCNKGIDKYGNLDDDVWYGQLKKEIRIVLKEPQGEDREAYNYFRGRIPLTGEGAKKLLEKFPTSTYAGWVLLEEADYNLKFKNAVYLNLKNKFDEFYKGKSKKYLDLSEYALKRIKEIEEYLKNAPNFTLKNWLLFEVAYWRMYMGEYDESIKNLKEVIKKDNGIAHQKAKELYEIYKEKGFIKD